MDEPTPGTCGIIKSEISEFFTDEWYVSVDGMEAVVNGEANARRVAAAAVMLGALRDALVDTSKPLRDWQIRAICEAIAKAQGLTE